jgi:hypothetical protein
MLELSHQQYIYLLSILARVQKARPAGAPEADSDSKQTNVAVA